MASCSSAAWLFYPDAKICLNTILTNYFHFFALTMSHFNNIKELINTLAWSKELLGEMFEKRKSFAYKYEQAVEIMEEERVETLISKGVIRQNGPYLDLDDQFQSFFEQ